MFAAENYTCCVASKRFIIFILKQKLVPFEFFNSSISFSFISSSGTPMTLDAQRN